MKILLAIILSCLLWVGFAFAAVDINTATAKEITALPGIGPAKAQAIVDYRAKNGPFKTKKDLTKVKGIGPKMLEKLGDNITVGK